MRLPTALVLTLGLVTACDAAAVTDDRGISCAAGSIRAQGSSAQANAVSSWIKDYQVNCPKATIEYESTGSGAGVRAFLAGKARTTSPAS
jgi:phosphate transport system substrate-binding protein